VAARLGEVYLLTRRLALGAVVGLLPLLGCSDESNSSDGANGTSEETEATSGTEAEDQELAESAILALDDLPSGWETSPPEEGAEEEELEFDENFADCLDIDVSEVHHDYPSADSSFENADDEGIGSEVAVAPSADDVAEDLELLRDPAAQRCFTEEISKFFVKSMLKEGQEDIELGEVTFNELSFEDFGDDSLAFRLTVPVSSQGFEVELYIDYVAVTKGRTGVTTTFQSVFTPFDTEEAQRLTAIVVDRIPADA
jgi:hypothetical protein